MSSVRVFDLAHSRTGDKGNTSNISVICYDDKDWEFLQRELTEARVLDAYRPECLAYIVQALKP